MAEQISPTSIAVRKGEYGNIEPYQTPANLEFDFAPVKLYDIARLVIYTDKRLFLSLLTLRLATDLAAYACIAGIVALDKHQAIDILFEELLLGYAQRLCPLILL